MSRFRPIALTLLVTAVAALCSAPSASADAICEVELASTEEGEVCEFPYDEGEELEAKSSKVLLSGASFEVTCESSMTLVVGEDLGDEKGLTGKASTWSMSGCKGSCSKAAWTALPYKTTSKASKEGDGTLTVSALEKEPSLSLEGCSLGGKCTYGAEKVDFAFNGGEPATMEASKAPAKRTSGVVCPSEATLTSTYTYQQPGGGRAFQAARSRPATVLCVVQTNPCSPGDSYPAVTAFEGKVTGAGIEFKWKGTVENTCPISTIKGTTEVIGDPMLTKITEWKFENCGPCKETKAMRLPWKGKLDSVLGDGNGQMFVRSGGSGNPVLEMIKCSGGVSCNFEAPVFSLIIEGHATEPKIKLSGETFPELSGGCGQLEIQTGVYKIENPTPLWVEKEGVP